MNTPIDTPLVLLLSALVLALAGLALASFRRRERDQQRFRQELDERDQQLRLALWASDEMYWQYDLRTQHLERVRIVADADNDLAVRLDQDRDTQIHPDDLPRVLDALRAHLRGDMPMLQIELRFRSEGDTWVWMRAHGRTTRRDAGGRATLVAGTARNIEALRELEGQHEVAIEVMRNMAESVAVLDSDFAFIAVNQAFCRMSGHEAKDVIGKDAALLNGKQHEPEFHAAARAAIRTQDHWTGEMWQQRKDGVDFLCAMQCTSIEDPRTHQRRYVIVASDITEQRRLEHELRFLANYDPLTNLPNRTQLSDRLARAIMQARQHATKVGVLFLDLDNFKDVNDTLGHAIGDRVLRAAAQRLLEAVGAERTVARIGGDEFTAVIEDIHSGEEADAYARRIVEAFDAPLRLDDRYEFTISPSVGVSLFPDHAQVPSDLLKHADTAMYQAKAAGKRTFVRYAEAMDNDIRHRANLMTALRRVLERNELQLVYQPQSDLRNGRIGCVEALLRWHSPEFGWIPPGQFIPLAEESGLIVPIGEWVIGEACRTLAAWRAAGVDQRLVMAVNVSALQLLRSDLAGSVHRALVDNDLPASVLELELTESVLMSNAELASERLQAFQRMGISIAVDDFGTGYSSLAYLHRLPINTLKIDKAFIDGLASSEDSEDTTITTTIIAMARTLGLLVVAEGVETPEQLAFLEQHHCDLAQGYWISRPLPAEACLRYLQGDPVPTPTDANPLDPNPTPA
ncbi:EAL domain-containing protein [Thermomonas sp.]|uniref:putative bifunctional diguanylate cyclase/phosphodiesterase n=1 Tax=Thermomonas sp. TaxID=1971895 RepID=UPI0026137C0B|nr:EAL domain-containing protein [Thermomonas sp.]MCO5056128.1 EAL domain-containing protein [Thermomonas sp.]HRO62733.1 EAL domain-containing protein [Thermomonas sp.]